MKHRLRVIALFLLLGLIGTVVVGQVELFAGEFTYTPRPEDTVKVTLVV